MFEFAQRLLVELLLFEGSTLLPGPSLCVLDHLASSGRSSIPCSAPRALIVFDQARGRPPILHFPVRGDGLDLQFDADVLALPPDLTGGTLGRTHGLDLFELPEHRPRVAALERLRQLAELAPENAGLALFEFLAHLPVRRIELHDQAERRQGLVVVADQDRATVLRVERVVGANPLGISRIEPPNHPGVDQWRHQVLPRLAVGPPLCELAEPDARQQVHEGGGDSAC